MLWNMKVNNVTRMLNQNKIEYYAFTVPAQKIGAVETSQYLGVSPNLVYKTIVVKRMCRGKTILVLIPGDHIVDLKALSKVVGEKKLHIPTEKEAEKITGLQAGGISPLALLNRGFQVVIDISAKALDYFYISGGQRGINLKISPTSVAELSKAIYANICKL